MEPQHRLKIGITGATGFIGQRLIDATNRIGHFPVAFTRQQADVDGCVETRRITPGKKIDVDGLDAIVNLAGEPIFGFCTVHKKRRILASRRDGTRALVDAILEARSRGTGPTVLINGSAIGYYGNTGDREIDESSPAGKGFLAEVSAAWEAEALRAEAGGVRVVILRIGLVLGRNGGAMDLLRPLFRLGLGVKFGSGNQWVSWVHVSDVARLTLHAIENSNIAGVLNATAPTPVRNVDFADALARQFHRRAWLTVPSPVLKLLLGEFAHAILDSHRVLPRRAEEFGYHCQYRKL